MKLYSKYALTFCACLAVGFFATYLLKPDEASLVAQEIVQTEPGYDEEMTPEVTDDIAMGEDMGTAETAAVESATAEQRPADESATDRSTLKKVSLTTKTTSTALNQPSKPAEAERTAEETSTETSVASSVTSTSKPIVTTSTPTPTPTPTPKPAPKPAPKPTPTPAPRPTPTPAPKLTPAPKPTPAPVNTMSASEFENLLRSGSAVLSQGNDKVSSNVVITVTNIREGEGRVSRPYDVKNKLKNGIWSGVRVKNVKTDGSGKIVGATVEAVYD